MIKALDFLRSKAPEGARILLVSGEESFLREQVLDRIRESLPAGVQWDTVDAGEARDGTQFAALLDELRTGSLFGGERLIHVENADALSPAQKKSLERFIAAGEAVHRLVIEGRSLVARGRKEAPRTGLGAAVARAGGALIQCDPLFDTPFQGRGPVWQSPLSRWVQERARSLGKRMTLEDAYALHRLVGTGLRELDRELSKLVLYVVDRPTITAADIEEVVARGRVAPVFDLGEMVALKDGRKALELSQMLFERGCADASGRRVRDPAAIALALTATIAARLRKVGRVLEMMASGNSFEEAARAVRQNRFFQDRLRAQVEAWRRAGTLRQAIRRLLELDRELKTGGGSPRALVDRFLVEVLHSRERASPWHP